VRRRPDADPAADRHPAVPPVRRPHRGRLLALSRLKAMPA
jgi:hypothetical protein